MERESFENADTAAVMNRHFVSVKVDREERPDVDHIYMQAVQTMTGQGGWPMTVFLTPDGTPFYGGTYFPPADRHGLPGFPRLLQALAEAWTNRRADVLDNGRQLAGSLGQESRLRAAGTPLGDEILFSAFQGGPAQFDYVLREMTDPAGGFYSAQDADSEGHEGKFFVWTADEIHAVLGAEAEAAMAYWGVDRGSNFEGKSILWLPGEPDPARAAAWRRKLFEVRERRVKPGRDDKVLAAWNGLMARAFAEAGRALGRADYLAAARRNAEFVLDSMRVNGRLLRTWKSGQDKLKGYLEDYAMVAAALLELYAATFDRLWLDEARGLADDMLHLFWDEGIGGFFDTGADHERLIVRPRNLYDNAVPCGSSVAVEVLLRLAALTGEERYERHALSALRPIADLMSRHPTAFGRFLCALDFHLGPRVEIALVAPTKVEETAPLAEEVFGRWLPNLVAAGMVSGHREGAAGVPLLEGRAAIDGKATAYVCRNYACELPVTDRAALAKQLDALPSR